MSHCIRIHYTSWSCIDACRIEYYWTRPSAQKELWSGAASIKLEYFCMKKPRKKMHAEFNYSGRAGKALIAIIFQPLTAKQTQKSWFIASARQAGCSICVPLSCPIKRRKRRNSTSWEMRATKTKLTAPKKREEILRCATRKATLNTGYEF